MKKLISLLLSLSLISVSLMGCDIMKNNDTPHTPSSENACNQNQKPEEKPEEKPESDDKTENTHQHVFQDGKCECGVADPDYVSQLPLGNQIDNRFLDLVLTTVNDEQINTADLRGKIIVFNVWATWCPPCKAELPDFNAVAAEYADDVVFIAVHTYDEGMFDMPSYVSQNFPDTKIIFAYDTSNSDGYYAAGGDGFVPQTAIIDRNGVIRYSDSGRLDEESLVTIIECWL
jgi:thiol-disulfide isomerase/thioredoxin